MLTAASSLACLEIRSRNEEAINSTRNMIYPLKVFTSYFIDADTFYLFLNWFSTRVSDDQKYRCGSRLYACINTRKFKGLDSREITSLPEIEKVITRLICIQWKFTAHDHCNFANYDSYFFYRPLSSVHLLQSNQRFQAIQFVDRHVSEKF